MRPWKINWGIFGGDLFSLPSFSAGVIHISHPVTGCSLSLSRKTIGIPKLESQNKTWHFRGESEDLLMWCLYVNSWIPYPSEATEANLTQRSFSDSGGKQLPWFPASVLLMLWPVSADFKDYIGSVSLSCVLGSGKLRQNQVELRRRRSDIKSLIVIGEILRDYSTMGY